MNCFRQRTIFSIFLFQQQNVALIDAHQGLDKKQSYFIEVVIKEFFQNQWLSPVIKIKI